MRDSTSTRPQTMIDREAVARALGRELADMSLRAMHLARMAATLAREDPPGGVARRRESNLIVAHAGGGGKP
jgi:hypothetical protein